MRTCQKIADSFINVWCWPLVQTMKLDNRIARTLLAVPAFLCIFPLALLLCIPFFLCTGPLDMIEYAWRGEYRK